MSQAFAHYCSYMLCFNCLDSVASTNDLFLPVINGLAVSLPTLLSSVSLSAAGRKENLNAVKMSVFLLCKLTESLESVSCRQSIVTAPGKVWVAQLELYFDVSYKFVLYLYI